MFRRRLMHVSSARRMHSSWSQSINLNTALGGVGAVFAVACAWAAAGRFDKLDQQMADFKAHMANFEAKMANFEAKMDRLTVETLPLRNVTAKLGSTMLIQHDKGFGTCFAVARSELCLYVVTARHCVEPSDPPRVHPRTRGPNDKMARFVWLHTSPAVDIAVVEMDDDDPSIPLLPLTESLPDVGSHLFNLTIDAEERHTGKLASEVLLSGVTKKNGLDCCVVTGPGRTGHSGSPVGSNDAVFGIVVAAAGPRQQELAASLSTPLDEVMRVLDAEFVNATSQRGIVMPLYPWMKEPKWVRTPIATESVELDTVKNEPTHLPSFIKFRQN